MAKTTKQKLAVDGTAKLAARAKSSDKHEKPDLTIEEATVASPRETRNRTGYFNDFEADEEHEGDSLGDLVDVPAKKGKKATKGAPTDTTAKEAKKGKGKKAAEAPTDEIAGNAGKAEKPTKTKRARSSNKDTVTDAPEDTTEADASATAGKPAKKAKSSKSAKEKADAANEVEGDTIADRVAADTAKSTKGKKGKPAKKEVVIGPSGDTAQVDDVPTPPTAKETKVKKTKAPAKEKVEKEPKSKKVPKQKETRETSKAEATPAPAEDAVKGAANDEAAAAKPRSKKPKRDAKKSDAEAEPAVEPDLAMDQGPFESLLDSGKDKAEENATEGAKAPKAKKTADRPKKAAKPKENKAEKSVAANGKDIAAKGKETVKKAAPAAKEATNPPKSKKRKASATVDAETVKEDILDPLAQHASASKKQKKDTKSRKSIGESLGELANTGLEAATSGANSIKQTIGGLANEAQKMLTDNTPEVASSLGEAKGAASAVAKKAKGKGKAVADSATAPVKRAEVDTAAIDDSDSEPDDQTVALLKGFESSGDDEPADEDERSFQEGGPIPTLPDEKATKEQLEALEKTNSKTEPGVVYLGRIPHGFYEHEMRAYFTQFGAIKRLRLSRNKKTGRSKHYAFVEFESEGVAKIVAGTMDNYLMYNHILKCKLVPKEDVHESMWKGANKRFKAVPRNKIEGRKLAMPVGKTHWEGRVERESEKRREKAEKAMTIGYEFVAPALKGVEGIKKAVEDEEQETSLVTAVDGEGTVIVSEEVKTKKVRKGAKGKAEEVAKITTTKTKRALEDGGEAVEDAVKKAKKVKKAA